MAIFLFAWNPKKWDWKEGELTKQVLKVAATGSAEDSWSCGNRKDLPIGSRFFLIRLGKKPAGIVGSGQTTTDPELRPHWDAALKKRSSAGLPKLPRSNTPTEAATHNHSGAAADTKGMSTSSANDGMQATGEKLPAPDAGR